MQGKADEYRRRASDAEELAQGSADAATKVAWLNIAQHWRDMANQIERMANEPVLSRLQLP